MKNWRDKGWKKNAKKQKMRPRDEWWRREELLLKPARAW